MSPNAPLDKLPSHNDSMDLVAQTRALNKKVTFWRRMAWLLIGGVVVFGAVLYSRGETRRRECRESLQHYMELAEKYKLSEQHPELLEQQWDQFETPGGGTSALHYDLIVRNWTQIPKAGESIPLAVCRDRHLTSFSIGRHVLMNTTEGYRIVWMKEDDAEHLARQARQDNPKKYAPPN
ncbi:MAG: hypothetical protein DCC65_07175 [Planctomycetota bacterium]|nr:MAG: hypothetical protein DCC65_07175 [Planctomycetota bacterium]